MSYDYSLIRTRLDRGVLTATIDNPPINLLTGQLFGQLNALTAEVETDTSVRVLVLESANPDFLLRTMIWRQSWRSRPMARPSVQPVWAAFTSCVNV